MLSDSAQDFLARRCDVRWVRTAPRWDDPETQKIWSDIADLGWLGLLFSESDGGLDLTMQEAVIIAEQSGRNLFPLPLGETAVLGGLVRRVEPAFSLPAEQICSGEASLSWLDIGSDGAHAMVDYAAQCSHVLVTRRGSDETIDVAVLPVDELTLKAYPALDPACTLAQWEPHAQERERLDSVAVTLPSAAARYVQSGWCLFRLADILGVARAGFDMTCDYVKERVQFGSTVGRFQAIKHRLADTAMALEVASLAVWDAATKHSESAPVSEVQLAVDFALVSVEQATARVRNDIIQLHGAIAYTWEHNAHLYQKRIIRLNTGLSVDPSIKRIAMAAISEL